MQTLNSNSQVILIGAGIMSATLGAFINELAPGCSIRIFERLERVAGESSDPWNNAGTGHSALCELNYTPQKADGSVDTSKALHIIEEFEVTKQFWSYLVEKHALGNPKDFIRSVPHMSFVHGNDNAAYLRKRFEALQQHELYKGMQYSEDPAVVEKWAPLVMEGRDLSEKVAATYTELGTDVNYGALTQALIGHLTQTGNTALYLEHEVEDLDKLDDGRWELQIKDLATGHKIKARADFVFIGAGGGALHLLQKSGIHEGKKYAGFPVGGQWLVCKTPGVVQRHHAKVYGQASVGAPPMSVPHLDTRVIDGQKAILFGPFATFSTKFLKEGSKLDLLETMKFWNLFSMIEVGLHNIDLEKYLVQQLALSFDDRMDALRVFYPKANAADWKLQEAGQRVQVIYHDHEHHGELRFGTEIVHAGDGSISALLGASPGASTAVSIMLDLLKACFPDAVTGGWHDKLKTIIPSYGQLLEGNKQLIKQTRDRTGKTLQLDWVQPEL